MKTKTYLIIASIIVIAFIAGAVVLHFYPVKIPSIWAGLVVIPAIFGFWFIMFGIVWIDDTK